MPSGDTMDMGDRWTSCNECVELIEAGKMPNKSKDKDKDLPLIIQIILEAEMHRTHQKVLEGISNKRYYVRSDADGRIKVNKKDSRGGAGTESN